MIAKNGICLSTGNSNIDFLVKDDDFFKLAKNPGLCLTLLKDSDLITIGRLGKAVEPDMFNYNPKSSIDVKDIPYKKEVGFYAKL